MRRSEVIRTFQKSMSDSLGKPVKRIFETQRIKQEFVDVSAAEIEIKLIELWPITDKMEPMCMHIVEIMCDDINPDTFTLHKRKNETFACSEHMYDVFKTSVDSILAQFA